MSKVFQPRFLTLAGMVILAAITRLLPHPWNLTPVAAMALFSGAHFERRWVAFCVPVLALLFSDLVLGFHSTMPFVYGAFLLTVLIGNELKNNKSAWSVIGATLVSSILFFIVTNVGVWLVTGLYERSVFGLAQCFIAALPFYRGTLLGDLAYTALLFGGFSLIQKRFVALRFGKSELSY